MYSKNILFHCLKVCHICYYFSTFPFIKFPLDRLSNIFSSLNSFDFKILFFDNKTFVVYSKGTFKSFSRALWGTELQPFNASIATFTNCFLIGYGLLAHCVFVSLLSNK